MLNKYIICSNLAETIKLFSLNTNLTINKYLFFYWLFKFYNQNYVIFMLIIVSTNNIFVTLYNFRLPPFFYMPLFYLLPISTNYNFWICRALQTVRVPYKEWFKFRNKWFLYFFLSPFATKMWYLYNINF